MMNQRICAFAVSMLVPAAIVAACAKRTVTVDVSAPPRAAAPAPPRSGGAAATESLGTSSLGTASPGTASPGTSEPRAPLGSARPAPAEFAARAEFEDIHFDFDRHDIRPGDARILDVSAAWLQENPGTLVLIEGHCDERGTDAYNLALGDRRAKAAMDYLVSRGIQAERMNTLSYGKEKPVCQEHTEACWAKNRHAHFLVKAR